MEERVEGSTLPLSFSLRAVAE